MVEYDVIILRCADLHTGLDGLLLNGPHPLDLQLGAEGGGDVLQHQADGIIQPGGGEQEAQEVQEGQLPPDQQARSHQDRGGQADPKERLGGAHEHAGGQLGVDGAPLCVGQPGVQLLQAGLLPVAGFDLPDGLQVLLDAVRHGPLGQNALGPANILELFGARRQ